MELRHLRYFVAVAEEENVTRAAERLRVSQPPLSRQIRDLEEELGVELFERTARSVRLTSAGRTFLEEARAVLRRAEEAVAKVRSARNRPSGVIAVGFAPSLTADLLPTVLRRFRKAHPSVRVSLHDMSSEEMLRALRSGTIALALMADQGRCLPKGFSSRAVRTQDFYVALPADHPLAVKKSLRMSDLLDLPLLGYSRSGYPEYFRSVAFLFGGKNPGKATPSPFSEEYESVSSLLAAVESGRGAALVSSGMGQLAGPGIALRPLLPKTTAAVLTAVWQGRKPAGSTALFLVFLSSPDSARHRLKADASC